MVKERFKKAYRHQVLDDKLTSRRLLTEARCLMKCRRTGIDTPALFMLDTERNRIFMEQIIGPTVKQRLRDLYDATSGTYQGEGMSIAGAMGSTIAKMHDSDIVHGDLTTSNIMMRKSEFAEAQGLVFIDFGLGFQSALHEDKAVDLYVMERALGSTHANSSQLADEVLRAYKADSRKSDSVMQKLAQVRSRGRKRECFG